MREPIFNPSTYNWEQPLDTPAEVARDVARAFAMDRGVKIRACLVELGWTPPDETKAAKAALAAAVDAVVRRGEAVHWDALERQLVAAHDALPTAD